MSATLIHLTQRTSPPGWALWQRRLLDLMPSLAREFVQRYTRPDGTLVWRERWPGMDGSDDAYESFFNFPLLAALGGDLELDRLARREWEAITRQFTEYGQVWREFDAYYDWMHHGESSLLFYYFGLSDPTDLRMRARAVRFAGMYIGEDLDAPNYDAERRLIRSPITGSRGPRFENSWEDWETHRAVLAHYPPPFDDIPGIPPGAKLADWNDDAIYGEILRLLNARQMRGDVPLNLTATSLIAHAFCYTGEAKYRDWILEYVRAWKERAEANGGILPDNVGPNGIIGECMDGKWFGGYYGWRWPHGFMTLIEPATIGAANALLMTGDDSWLELPRQLLDALYAAGQKQDGDFYLPHRYKDDGWHDFRALSTRMHGNVPAAQDYPIHLWYLSMREEDRMRIERWRQGADWSQVAEGRGKGDNTHTPNWYAFLHADNPDYPERILQVNYREVMRRCAAMNADTTDPETWDVHHWQDLNPVVCEGLVQLMLGGPNAIYHGGLLHTQLRYFDPDRKRPGVPPDVAALVSAINEEGVVVQLINLHPLQERRVVLQAGMFGEHGFTGVSYTDSENKGHEVALNSPHCEALLAPGAGGSLTLTRQRFVHLPRYGTGAP